MRPQDEPGVLPRAGRAPPAVRVPRPPLAPPLRSMLKIELGGIDEFLASQPRLLLEQRTGMRLATDLSAPDRQSAAAIASDRGFKQAHARYVAAMRDAVGDNIDIMVDCHARPSPAMGLQFAKALDSYGLYFLEEPCWPESVEGLAAINAAVTTPIATGERGTN